MGQIKNIKLHIVTDIKTRAVPKYQEHASQKEGTPRSKQEDTR